VSGANLTVEVGADALLQHAGGAGDALVDGGVEVEEGQGRWQLGAGCRQPVTIMIDAADGGRGDALQVSLEGREVVDSDLDTAVARVLGEGDPLVGGAAGIVGVVVVAAFHFQNVGEGALEERIVGVFGWIPDRRCGAVRDDG